jgi:hypothetical protein
MTIRTSLRALAAAAVLIAPFAASDAKADWREKYKVIKLGSVTVENQAATVTRFKPTIWKRSSA